jgi:type III secretion protein V
MSCELRQHAAALLLRVAVERAFESLAQALPSLIAIARTRISVSQLARVMRELLAEEVSVRNLPRIIETILDCDYILADEARQIVFDERLAFLDEPPSDWKNDPVPLAASIRRAFKRYLSHKYTRGQSTMITCLLDPKMEEQLAAHASGTSPLNDTDLERIIAAARSEIEPLLASSQPTVLTSTEARRPFRKLIGPIFPWLPVVAFQELSPEMNIQPVARITVVD